MGLQISLSDTNLPQDPDIIKILDMYHQDNRFDRVPQQDEHQRAQIASVEKFYTLFPKTKPSFLAALLLQNFNFWPLMSERESLKGKLSKSCLDSLDSIRSIFDEGLDNLATEDIYHYALFIGPGILNNIIQDVEHGHADFLKASNELEEAEQRFSILQGKTGKPELEDSLSILFQKARGALDSIRKDVPEELQSFEQSGLPDHTIIRKAYNYMIKVNSEGIASNAVDICCQDIKLAKEIYEQGWSSDPEVVALALMAGPYAVNAHEPGIFEDEWDKNFIKLMRECESSEGYGRASRKAKHILAAQMLLELESGNQTYDEGSDAEIVNMIQGKPANAGPLWLVMPGLFWCGIQDHQELVSGMQYLREVGKLPAVENSDLLIRIDSAVKKGREFLDKIASIQSTVEAGIAHNPTKLNGPV